MSTITVLHDDKTLVVGIVGPQGPPGPEGPPGTGTGPPHGGTIGIVIDGGGGVIQPGVKGYFEVGVGCTITDVTVLSTDANATPGDIVLDVWKAPFGGYPPTVANSITASAKPALSNASKSKDSALLGWQTGIVAGDILGFYVESAGAVTRVSLSLTVQL